MDEKEIEKVKEKETEKVIEKETEKVIENEKEKVKVKEKEKKKANEKRKAVRHDSAFQSSICALIRDGDTYPLLNPISVNVVNVSKNGIRFVTVCNTFLVGDKFIVLVKLKEEGKLFTAQVINIKDKNADESEYGCLLIDRKSPPGTFTRPW